MFLLGSQDACQTASARWLATQPPGLRTICLELARGQDMLFYEAGVGAIYELGINIGGRAFRG